MALDVLRTRAAINILTFNEANCNATPASMMAEPMNNAARRPRWSDANGVKGSP